MPGSVFRRAIGSAYGSTSAGGERCADLVSVLESLPVPVCVLGSGASSGSGGAADDAAVSAAQARLLSVLG